MEVLSPYDVTTFNTLPDLGDSNERFNTSHGLEALQNSIGRIFIEHGLHHLFGVCLLHKHAMLQENQALVDANGTSTPWQLGNAEILENGTFKKFNGLIKPHSWAVVDGKLVPYEFYFDPEHQAQEDDAIEALPVADLSRDFLRQFTDLLDLHELTSIIGLRLIRNLECLLEVTEGFANITWPIPSERKTDGTSIQAFWTFHDTLEKNSSSSSSPPASPEPMLGCRLSCRGYCDSQGEYSHSSSHDTGGHQSLIQELYIY